MARVSKKKPPQGGKPDKVYSVGIYARLSVDLDDRKNESIETQIAIAKEFIQRQDDMEFYASYTDLGKTGTNFDREGFERMMQDVRMRNIDCIVVKDLSRFGRNHIETGNYIEKIFPFLGVRFVAVTDQFDSMALSGQDEAFGLHLKNLVNEMYARDIAAKVKSGKKAKWEQGSYTGGIPPYGYRAEWAGDRKCLFPEEPAAGIVKKIFNLFVSGKNMKEIALWLYDNKIVRPGQYHKTGQAYCQQGEGLEQWPRGTVKMILTNPVYMGCLVQGRACGRQGRASGGGSLRSQGWSVKEHTHAAIISESLFFQAAARFEEFSVYCNQNGYSKRVPIEGDIFAGILYCGDCGSRMKRTAAVKEFSSKGRARTYSYHCPNASRIDAGKCKARGITLDALGTIVREVVRMEFALSPMMQEGMAGLCREVSGRAMAGWEEELLLLGREMENLKKLGSGQYLNYRMGGIDAGTFQQMQAENSRKAAVLQKRQAEILEKQKTGGQEDVSGILPGWDGEDGLPPALVQALVRRIEVYQGYRVNLIFSFQRGGLQTAEKGLV